MERLLRRLLLRVERRPVGVLLVVQCLRRGVLLVVERCQLGLGRVRMLGAERGPIGGLLIVKRFPRRLLRVVERLPGCLLIRIRVPSSEGVRSVFRR